nr:MAG TPA: hypothetical protein [Caudoviricetes sp.]
MIRASPGIFQYPILFYVRNFLREILTYRF